MEKNKINEIKDIFFSKALEEIYFSKEDKEKILNQKRIYLEDIFPTINDKEIIQQLLKYEEQNHILNERRLKLLYNRGFDDALKLTLLIN